MPTKGNWTGPGEGEVGFFFAAAGLDFVAVFLDAAALFFAAGVFLEERFVGFFSAIFILPSGLVIDD
jgi:hypothetical protein